MLAARKNDFTLIDEVDSSEALEQVDQSMILHGSDAIAFLQSQPQSLVSHVLVSYDSDYVAWLDGEMRLVDVTRSDALPKTTQFGTPSLTPVLLWEYLGVMLGINMTLVNSKSENVGVRLTVIKNASNQTSSSSQTASNASASTQNPNFDVAEDLEGLNDTVSSEGNLSDPFNSPAKNVDLNALVTPNSSLEGEESDSPQNIKQKPSGAVKRTWRGAEFESPEAKLRKLEEDENGVDALVEVATSGNFDSAKSSTILESRPPSKPTFASDSDDSKASDESSQGSQSSSSDVWAGVSVVELTFPAATSLALVKAAETLEERELAPEISVSRSLLRGLTHSAISQSPLEEKLFESREKSWRRGDKSSLMLLPVAVGISDRNEVLVRVAGKLLHEPPSECISHVAADDAKGPVSRPRNLVGIRFESLSCWKGNLVS
jgi:hypothetical protein